MLLSQRVMKLQMLTISYINDFETLGVIWITCTYTFILLFQLAYLP